MRKILVVLMTACFLTGCVGLGQSGVVPWRSDRMVHIVEFDNIQAGVLDADGNPTEGESIHYKSTTKGKAGDVIAAINRMSVKVDGEKWSIDLAQDATMDATERAIMLSTLGLAEYEFAAKVSADVVSAAINAVLPGYLAKTEAGVAKKQIDADTLRLIASEVVRLIEGGGALQPPR